MNKLDQIFAAHKRPQDYAKAYIEHLSELLRNLDMQAIGRVIEIFLEARENGKHIFFFGNGGSAATASHFANDIAIGTRCLDKPFKALSLTDNNSIMTAIGNDDGYDQIFVQQLKVLVEPGDVVVAISASGNSANILNAIDYANEQDCLTIGLTGFEGGKLLQSAKHVIHVQTSKGEYGPVEDVHMVMDHLIGTYLKLVVHNG